jgi:type II secretory ATPase GspE/PulE/Tfp pilus assembly ATPase PilB-like protein
MSFWDTHGRIAIFEMFKIDKEVQAVILKNPTNEAIYEVVRKKGMIMMKEDAMFKSLDGIIPFTEVYNFNSENE